jgi:hypothetical protein
VNAPQKVQTMAASLSGVFSVQQFTDIGGPLVGGRLYTYVPGTTTMKIVYTDPAGLIPHTYTADSMGGQYLALNARGELPAPMYLTAGGCDLALKTTAGATIWTRRATGASSELMAILNQPNGAAQVGFLQAGTGAVPRTLQDKAREVISVADFGADPTASQDSAEQIQAAIDYAESLANSGQKRGAVVQFPPGQFLVGVPLTIRTSRVALRGAGSFHSQLVRNKNYGPTLRIQSQGGGSAALLERIEVSGLSMWHDTGPGVAMVDPHLEITGVTHGRFNDLDINQGAYGVVLYGGVDIEFEGCNIVGQNTGGAFNGIAGVVLKDLEASGFSAGSLVSLPTQISFSNCEIFGPLNTGFQYGLVINAAEDVTLSNCYLGNAKTYNVFIQQLGGARDRQILEVAFSNGTYIDGSGADGVRIEGALGSGANYIGTVSFVGCDLKGQGGQTPGHGIFVDGTPRAGAYAQACRNLRISGCRIGDYAGNGIWLVGCQNALVEGNMIGGNNYNGTGGGRGILVGGACDKVSIYSNRIGSAPQGNGSSLQTAGVELVAGATNMHVNGNDLRHNVAALVDLTGSAATNGKRITNNAGFNEGRAALSPTMVPTATEFQNPYGSPCFVSVYGGTVTNIALNGQVLTASANAMFPVGPGDRVAINYSAAPSWLWWPM